MGLYKIKIMRMGRISHKIKCISHQKSGLGVYCMETKCIGRLLSKNKDE